MPTTSSISTRNLTDFSAAHLLRDVQYSTIVQVVKVVIQVVQLVRVVQVVKWWMWDVSVKQHKAFTGAFAYHYRHLEFERCLISPVAPLVWLVWVVQLVKSSGEIAYHYYYSTEELRGRGFFQLVQLVQVIQVVKLHVITLTYSTVEFWGRGSFQLVRLLQVVQEKTAYHYSCLQYGRAVRKGSFHLVRVVQVVQLVSIIETYSPVELWGRGPGAFNSYDSFKRWNCISLILLTVQ